MENLQVYSAVRRWNAAFENDAALIGRDYRGGMSGAAEGPTSKTPAGRFHVSRGATDGGNSLCCYSMLVSRITFSEVRILRPWCWSIAAFLVQVRREVQGQHCDSPAPVRLSSVSNAANTTRSDRHRGSARRRASYRLTKRGLL